MARPLKFGSKAYYRQVTQGTHPPAMFATADEIVKSHNLADITFFGHLQDKVAENQNQPQHIKNRILEAKRRDDVGQYLQSKIEDEGYVDKSEGNPYEGVVLAAEKLEGHSERAVAGPVLLGGHHRVAVMQKMNPNEFIPIQTYRNFDEATTKIPAPYLVSGINTAHEKLNEVHALMQQHLPAAHHTYLRDAVGMVREHLMNAKNELTNYRTNDLDMHLMDAANSIDDISTSFPLTPHTDKKLAELQDHLNSVQNSVHQ